MHPTPALTLFEFLTKKKNMFLQPDLSRRRSGPDVINHLHVSLAQTFENYIQVPVRK